MEQTLVIIETETDLVQNIIVWAGPGQYDPSPGYFAVAAPGARIGWLWNNGEQVEPNPPAGE